MSPEETTCKTCGHSFQGNYCNSCGQKVIKRFTASYLWEGFKQEIFELDNGLWHTYRDMWIRPGEMVRDYINGATNKYYGPLKYMIFWTALYLILLPIILSNTTSDLFTNDTLSKLVFNSNAAWSKEAMQDFTLFWFRFVSQNTNYYFFGLIPFMSLAGFLIHKKSNINFTEHIILNTYFCGHFASLAIPIALLSPHNKSLPELSQSIYSLAILLVPYYYLFFKMQKGFYKENWKATILKGLGIILIGPEIFILFLFLIFNIIKIL